MTNTNNITVCAIIVTYGERFTFLARVVERLIEMDIDQLVLIDNGSPVANHQELQKLAASNPTLITLYRFEANEGSAIGFKTGMEMGRKGNSQFIWILDDDNLPEPDALQKLKIFWQNRQAISSGIPVVALSAMRKDREVFIRAVEQRKPEAFLWPANSFIGFHVKEIWRKLKERIRSGADTPKPPGKWEPLKLSVGFYGGLFFPVSLLEKTGLPDESIILYSDDLHFTNKITTHVGELWLVPDSLVHDIDTPYYIQQKKGMLYHSSLDGGKDALVYYSIRNAVYYIRKHMVTRPLVYTINKWLFLGFITMAGILRGKTKRLRLIYGAIRDGQQGRMGKNTKYTL